MVDWLGTTGWMEKLAWRGVPSWSYVLATAFFPSQRRLASGPHQHCNCAA